MRVDHLVHKAGLTQGDASEIEVATQNSGGHDAKADCGDLRRESELGSEHREGGSACKALRHRCSTRQRIEGDQEAGERRWQRGSG
jgi:hypothetical protein